MGLMSSWAAVFPGLRMSVDFTLFFLGRKKWGGMEGEGSDRSWRGGPCPRLFRGPLHIVLYTRFCYTDSGSKQVLMEYSPTSRPGWDMGHWVGQPVAYETVCHRDVVAHGVKTMLTVALQAIGRLS